MSQWIEVGEGEEREGRGRRASGQFELKMVTYLLLKGEEGSTHW